MKRTTKASVRNGRAKKNKNGTQGSLFNARHNFEKELRDLEAHINHDLTDFNIMYKITSDGTWKQVKSLKAREYEISRFDEIYGTGQNAKNERYINSGHREDCKTILDVYGNKKTAPLETIVQLSNYNDIKNGLFTFDELKQKTHEAAERTFKDLQKKFGKNIELLDYVLHVDEGVPHVHVRYCFKSIDKFGFVVPNQSQALKEMGFTVSKEERSKYENSLIKFSDYLREQFYQNCERYKDIIIDREVVSQSHRQDEKLRQNLKKEQSLEDLRFNKMQEEMYNRNQQFIEEQNKTIEQNDEILNQQNEKIKQFENLDQQITKKQNEFERTQLKADREAKAFDSITQAKLDMKRTNKIGGSKERVYGLTATEKSIATSISKTLKELETSEIYVPGDVVMLKHIISNKNGEIIKLKQQLEDVKGKIEIQANLKAAGLVKQLEQQINQLSKSNKKSQDDVDYLENVIHTICEENNIDYDQIHRRFFPHIENKYQTGKTEQEL